MKRPLVLFLAMVFPVLLAVSAAVHSAHATAAAYVDPAVVAPEPIGLQVEPDEEFLIDFYLNGATDLYGIDLRVKFDPAILEVVDSDPYQNGIQLIQGEIPSPDFVVYDTADNTAGTIKYVVTQLSPTPPASGEGSIVSVMFHAKAAGHSAITIEKVSIADATGVSLPVQSANGDVVVGTPTGPTATTAPAATATATQAPGAATPTTLAATPSPTVAASNTIPAAAPTLAPTLAPATATPLRTPAAVPTQPASPLAAPTSTRPASVGAISPLPTPTPPRLNLATATATATRVRPTASPTADTATEIDSSGRDTPLITFASPAPSIASRSRVGPAVNSPAPAVAEGQRGNALNLLVGGGMMLAGVLLFVGYFLVWPRLTKS